VLAREQHVLPRGGGVVNCLAAVHDQLGSIS
jgi:hypothetical protein